MVKVGHAGGHCDVFLPVMYAQLIVVKWAQKINSNKKCIVRYLRDKSLRV